MAAGPDWKARAEGMVSSFIDGKVANGDPYYGFMENASTPPSQACGYDSVYDRLLGCGGCTGGHNCGGGGQCVSLFMQWVRLVLGGVVRAYLSSPLCLALLPLFVGLGVGYWMGRNSGSNYQSTKQAKGGIFGALAERAYHMHHWMSLQLLLLLVFLDPRRCKSIISDDANLFRDDRDEEARLELRAVESKRESGVDPDGVPKHIAVIMDGNRRYGKAKYGNAARGHWDGSKTLIEFAKWCISEGVEVLTVYAFSTENWERDPAEVSALMAIFCKYCDELRVEAIQRGIRMRVLATEEGRIPEDVKVGIDRMVLETQHCDQFTMNICLSYGGRGEIVNACKSVAKDVQSGTMRLDQIGERELQRRMLTGHCPDPDVVIRTSGEERLSNFLLWQVAYSEFFFLQKPWPELEKADLLGVIRSFALGRRRRYGK